METQVSQPTKLNVPLKQTGEIQEPKLAQPQIEEDAPVLALPGFGPVTARCMIVLGVHFREKRERFFHSNRREFVLPKAEKGEVAYIKVYDSQQMLPNTSDPSQPPDQAGMVPGPVPVESVVLNLEQSWGYMQINRVANRRLGIQRLNGPIPPGVFPRQSGTIKIDSIKDAGVRKQVNVLLKMQEAACRALVLEADTIQKTGKGIISDVHRDALQWLDSERRDWYAEIESGHTKIAVTTGNRIPMQALVDDKGQDLIRFYAEHDLNPADFGDTFVAGRPELLKKAKDRLATAK